MADVAKANGVPFVDLFTPSQKLYEDAAREGKTLTVNGHYLKAEADKLLASVMFKAIFGAAGLRAIWKNCAARSSIKTTSGTPATARSTATTSTAAAPRRATNRRAGGPRILNFTR